MRIPFWNHTSLKPIPQPQPKGPKPNKPQLGLKRAEPHCGSAPLPKPRSLNLQPDNALLFRALTVVNVGFWSIIVVYPR